MGLFKSSKKVLVSTINNNNCFDGDADCIHTRFSYSTIHIYYFLNYGIFFRLLKIVEILSDFKFLRDTFLIIQKLYIYFLKIYFFTKFL